MDSAQFFATTFVEADLKFRAAAAARGIEVRTWAHPGRGPGGEALHTSVCEFGPRSAETVLVLNSGVHGTEAFVGSGLQVGVLSDPEGFLARAPGVRVVMIHILNPYGAAWGRYVNEDNVDLMKNITFGDIVSATDPIFLEFDDAVDFASLSEPAAYAAAQARRAVVADKYGMDRLMHALKIGQSARPDSICFNGVGATWSTRTLDAILAETLRGARRACFLDLHSGVGGWGESYVMTADHLPSRTHIGAWLGDLMHESDLPTDPPTYSTLDRAARGVALVAASMEAGTVPFGEAFREAMAFEMYYHLHGDRDCDHAREMKRVFMEHYYPPSDAWRREAWANARAMFDRFLDGLQAWDREAVPA